ncbi:MAG TPA: zinc-binding alcohol dehydrogenase [Polyangiaceae bacterium]|nr:zinc-binding alcohol dehydrogenase [Polyangiaceae bacterium]
MPDAEAFWVVAPERGEIRREELAEPGEDEVLVQALYSGVSRGTELTVFRGKVPHTEHARMRAPHQAGEFPSPVKYGYASVGRVLRGPVSLVGRDVFCLFPHQSAYVVPASDVVPLPPGVPPRRGVLAANMETALNGVWDAGLRAGDRVTVVGAGVVGLLVAYLAALHPGVRVQVVDVDVGKAEVVRGLGGRFAGRSAAEADADLVVHASATAAGLETALALAGYEATVLELSWYGEARPAVPLGEGFHAKRLRLQSSQVGGLPAIQRARWTHRRRLELALSLLTDARLDALLTSTGLLAELNDQLRRFSSGAPGLCHVVDYMKQA